MKKTVVLRPIKPGYYRVHRTINAFHIEADSEWPESQLAVWKEDNINVVVEASRHDTNVSR